MKNVAHYSPINAELWLELEKRMNRKSKAITTNSCLNLRTSPKVGEIDDNHWYIDQIKLDFELKNFERKFTEKSVEMLDKVYKALSDDDKKIIDDHIQDGINEAMMQVYNDLADNDFGQGVYMSEGMYLQSDGRLRRR